MSSLRSVDYTPLDGTGMFKAVDEFGLAKDVDVSSGHEKTVFTKYDATDANGDIFYSATATPCRSYLPKQTAWAADANPLSH